MCYRWNYSYPMVGLAIESLSVLRAYYFAFSLVQNHIYSGYYLNMTICFSAPEVLATSAYWREGWGSLEMGRPCTTKADWSGRAPIMRVEVGTVA